jgi:hypothetical protein
LGRTPPVGGNQLPPTFNVIRDAITRLAEQDHSGGQRIAGAHVFNRGHRKRDFVLRA